MNVVVREDKCFNSDFFWLCALQTVQRTEIAKTILLHPLYRNHIMTTQCLNVAEKDFELKTPAKVLWLV